ncbi:hypothetical protein Tco_0965548 [Tanacetum coccineum]
MNSPPNHEWEEGFHIDDSDLLLTPVPIRIIPGLAGIVQTAKLRKLVDTQEGGEESVMSTQEYIRKVIEDVDVKKFLKNEKLEKVVAVIKSCISNALGDLTVALKYLSSTIFGTIHDKVLTEEKFAKAITVGAALILHNVSVF